MRKCRITCVAPTYRILWDTAIPSYLKVWPKTWGQWSGAKGDPAEHVFSLNFNGAPVQLEMKFRALQDKSAEEFMRGRETTGWWFPETDTMPAEDLLSLAANRVGRYPEPDDRWDPEEARAKGWAPAWAGVYGDFNAPIVGSWFHDKFYLRREDREGLFMQPPGLLADGTPNAEAENLHNLRKIDPDYYRALASKMSDYDIARLLMCRPGWPRLGKPVYAHFRDEVHVATVDIEPDPSLRVVIGADAGQTLNPAATFSQVSYSNQRRVIEEITPVKRQMDLTEFAAEIRRTMDTRFPRCREAEIIVDPSAKAGSTMNRAISYAQLLQAHTGIAVRLAPSNKPEQRISAVSDRLRRSAGPGEPALLISPRCRGLIAAYSGGYHFAKTGNAYRPLPEKNEHSHEADADQYAELGVSGLGATAGGFIPPSARASHNGPGVILD
ncbi:hypothetical protein [Caulobacter hibisci]|uniref:Terminase large subunit gp17-like C-terminal domain-containing protein n=1 Tax=Caulobacter hibisci TaxID=2035993 RepID=A0ABS0SYD6_9CAUL|nr:hypothetical protein [Caulobacter hibisci]MBI1684449.1 hypothetical protein [Caulobacter hibisci]